MVWFWLCMLGATMDLLTSWIAWGHGLGEMITTKRFVLFFRVISYIVMITMTYFYARGDLKLQQSFEFAWGFIGTISLIAALWNYTQLRKVN